MRNLALIGKARAGKDSAAAHLVRQFAYTRLAFADPLKEMALKINPAIPYDLGQFGNHHVRLATLVEHVGWERAKDEYPEVRRLLQHMGQAQREWDPDFWVNMLLRKVAGAEKLNMPVVVTDVRYRNEALALRSRGFRLVRIIRPLSHITGPHAHVSESLLASHTSETQLDDFAADVELINSGSLDALHAAVAAQVV